jgi:hypothetical protein
MAQKHPIDADIAIEVVWPPEIPEGDDPVVDASLCRFSLRLFDQILTSYKSDKGDVGSHLEIPTYHLVEWIASNWWPLLFEPPKGDSEESDDYNGRHWIGVARNGFALPDVSIVPAGDRIEITARECYLRFARLTFLENANGSVARESVASTLQEFVEGALRRLSANGISDTPAHEAWGLIKSTDQKAEEYCRLVGSLGLCPYDDHTEIDAILERVTSVLDRTMITDLCEAADVSSFRSAAVLAEKLKSALPQGQAVDLSCLRNVEIPLDNLPAAYRWGLEATKRVRQHLGISSRDPSGGNSFFDQVGLDVSKSIVIAPDNASDLARVAAALEREDVCLNVALGEAKESQRRFTAARAAFLGWIKADHTRRLVTGARTRDQQASRAFAAELLAPISYIQSRTGGRTISVYRIDEIADELAVSPAVVRYQAQNNRMHVADNW